MSTTPSELPLIKASWPVPGGGWPDAIAQVSYEYRAGPTSSEPPSWLDGSNCQRFAYGVLSLFNIVCPPLRSSDLWSEQMMTRPTTTPAPLDLILFNATDDPYGAHVGVWMTSTDIVHLCHEVGRPTAWSLEEFAGRSRYAHVIGTKTVVRETYRLPSPG